MRHYSVFLIAGILVPLATGSAGQRPNGAADGGMVQISSVAGKKLIRAAKELRR